MTVVALRAKDKSSAQLNAGISAAATSIVLKSGEGANFPQPYTGTASSAGSNTVLNDTGDLGGLAVDDIIRNVTDGSWAYVVTAGTNSITTTQLRGGTDNTWDSGDTWRSSEFIVTLAAINASGNDTAYEEVLISNRSTDTLTVAASGRAYNGTTAQSFLADDYVQLRITAPYHGELNKIIKETKQQVDTNTTNVTTATTNITNLQTGAYHYVVATGSSNAYVAATPALGAYAAGNIVRFKANHTNTGAATINVNSLGAKDIKKNDGATALAANDIISGQIIELQYDGTNFQMLSPIGTPGTQTTASKLSAAAQSATAGGDTIANTGTATNMATTKAIGANVLAVGDVVEIYCAGWFSSAGANTDVLLTYRFGTVDIATNNTTTLQVSQTNAAWDMCLKFTVRAIGASGNMLGGGHLTLWSGTQARIRMYSSAGDPTAVTSALDTTGILTGAFRVDWVTADASNSWTMAEHYIRITRNGVTLS